VAARVGRLVDLEVDASDADEARTKVAEMCERLLANPLIESYEIELERDA
jgi:phosphoribosylformylglycinamidine synthase subunit PurS